MVVDLAVYTVVHQPRRLKLPAQPIPRGASADEIAHCLFDERMNERYFHQVAQNSYYPAAQMFLDLVQEGMKLSLGFSLSFIRQVSAWDKSLLALFQTLVAHENVELISVEPYHSYLYLLDLPAFVTWMQDMVRELESLFGKRPVVVDTIGMRMSTTLYCALDAAGFHGILSDGSSHLMDWREATHLYYAGETAPYALPLDRRHLRRGTRKGEYELEKREHAPRLLTRHVGLSEDIRSRFSDRRWDNYPLYAGTYADWIAHATGEIVILGWDLETFGEHQCLSSGIFDFMRSLPEELQRRDVSMYTASEIIERHQDAANHLPLPLSPLCWDDSDARENEAQHILLQLMSEIYGVAKLTNRAELIDIAVWLSQTDNLRLLQGYGSSTTRETFQAAFLPSEWCALGLDGIVSELRQVYLNTLSALQPHLPAQLWRQPVHKAVRRKVVYVEREPTLSYVARHA